MFRNEETFTDLHHWQAREVLNTDPMTGGDFRGRKTSTLGKKLTVKSALPRQTSVESLLSFRSRIADNSL